MSSKIDFPTMTSPCGQFITTNGNFYQQIDCGALAVHKTEHGLVMVSGPCKTL